MTGSPQAAWVAWAVVIFSPLHWFYGAVAEVYAAETAAATGVAMAAYAMQTRRPQALVWLALSLFAASLVKLPVVLLLLPTVAMAAVCHPWRGRVQVALVTTAALAGAMTVLALIEPLDALFATSAGQVGEVAHTSFIGTWNPRALNRSLRDVLYATLPPWIWRRWSSRPSVESAGHVVLRSSWRGVSLSS
jgi:hypothetical protein